MAEHDITNIGIIAHVDAGKTTLTEQLLFRSGAILRAGSVDQGTAQTDYMDVERKRGISVKAATTYIRWQDKAINLIDTPGHVDFAAEVERSLRVLDAAVLCLSAVEGVQAQSEQYYFALRKLNVPVLIFINKTDRAGADVGQVRRQIRELLGPEPSRSAPVRPGCQYWPSTKSIWPTPGWKISVLNGLGSCPPWPGKPAWAQSCRLSPAVPSRARASTHCWT